MKRVQLLRWAACLPFLIDFIYATDSHRVLSTPWEDCGTHSTLRNNWQALIHTFNHLLCRSLWVSITCKAWSQGWELKDHYTWKGLGISKDETIQGKQRKRERPRTFTRAITWERDWTFSGCRTLPVIRFKEEVNWAGCASSGAEHGCSHRLWKVLGFHQQCPQREGLW